MPHQNPPDPATLCHWFNWFLVPVLGWFGGILRGQPAPTGEGYLYWTIHRHFPCHKIIITIHQKNGSGTTTIHDYPLTYAIISICFLARRVTLLFSDGKPLPSWSYNSTIQSGSLSSITQKWLRPLCDVRNTRLPMCCSMIHCALLHIRLAKRFFALREIGVTIAVFMNLDAFCMCLI